VLGADEGDLLRAAVHRFRGVWLDEPAMFLADPATIAIVTLDGEEVVGWARGTRQRHACGYTQVQLYEIGVAPTRRGEGLGRALLDHFLRLVTAEGHRRMWLFTDEANVVAKSLYESAGGRPSPHQDATYWWQLGPTE
jgi:ribosomal protein S18 acetylase RimI-like enzyme